MDDKIRINLLIADINFPVQILPENEEVVRKAAKQVNDKIMKFRTKWPDLNLEKILAVTAYEFSLQHLLQIEKNDTAPYAEKIKELTETLEEYFKAE